MSKLKKVLLMCTAYVLVAALAIGGTIAYLQDDDSDVNVMTLGNVSIAQHEYEREVDTDGNYVVDSTGYVLQPFTQDKPLYPATEIDANGLPYNYGAGDYDTTRVKMSQVGSHGSMDVFVNKNAQDKFVTVENTGKTDAYVRTLIAYELGSVGNFNDVIMTSCFMTDQGVWKANEIGSVVIDGNNYLVIEYIYNGAKSLGGVHENGVLPAGDTTYPSLAQVYMKATATNEDVEKIDGNKNGKYDILVLSQAVQAAGFDSAAEALEAGFPKGTDNENVAKWFGGVIAEHSTDTWDGTESTSWYSAEKTEFEISSVEELLGLESLVNDQKIDFAGKTIVLTKNLDMTGVEWEPIGHYMSAPNSAVFKGTFDGKGHTISNLSTSTYYGAHKQEGAALFGVVGYGCTIKNLNMSNVNAWSIYGYASALIGSVRAGDVTIENVHIDGARICAGRHIGGFIGISGRTGQEYDCSVTFTNCSMKNIEMVYVHVNNSTDNIIGDAGTQFDQQITISGLDSVEKENITVTKDRDLFYQYQVGN